MKAPTPEDFGQVKIKSNPAQFQWTKRGGYFMYHAALKQWKEVLRTHALLMDSTICPDLARVYGWWYDDAMKVYREILHKWEHYEDKSPVIEPYSTDLRNECKLSDVYLNKAADEAEEVRKCGGGCRSMKVKSVVEEIFYKEYTKEELDYVLHHYELAKELLSDIMALPEGRFTGKVRIDTDLYTRIILWLITDQFKVPSHSTEPQDRSTKGMDTV